MNNKIEEIFFVLKWSDIEKYLDKFDQKLLSELCDKITVRRIAEGKHINKYIVCNQDEPYAEKVWQLILDGEDKKGGTNERRSGEAKRALLELDNLHRAFRDDPLFESKNVLDAISLAISAIQRNEAAIAYINADERMFPYPETAEEKSWNSCVRVMRDGIIAILEGRA